MSALRDVALTTRPLRRYLRRDLRPARISSERNFGCSQAAKCPPLGGLCAVNQVGIGLLGPTPAEPDSVVGEDAHGNRDGDAFGIEIAPCPNIPNRDGRQNPRVRQPGDRDVVENIVAREALRLSVEDVAR